MKKIKLLVTGLVLIIIASFLVFFLNPDKLTPENPAGKTKYYTMIVNSSAKLNSNQRYDYTLDAYDVIYRIPD